MYLPDICCVRVDISKILNDLLDLEHSVPACMQNPMTIALMVQFRSRDVGIYPLNTLFMVRRSGYLSPHTPLKSSVSMLHIIIPPSPLDMTYLAFSSTDLATQTYYFTFLFLYLLSLFLRSRNSEYSHSIIVSNPLVALESIRYTLFRFALHRPSPLNIFADLVVTKHTSFSRVRTSFSRTDGFRTYVILRGTRQGEGSTVSRNTNNEFLRWCTLFEPIFNRPVLKRKCSHTSESIYRIFRLIPNSNKI